jgi:PAS domain S-box-containing protein
MENYKILLVDDEPFILQSIGPALVKKGYEVTTAESGQEALDVLNKSSFDLVLTDLIMDDVDGFQVLKGVKELNKETMVIVLTGHGDVTLAINCLRLGADDYVLKPCELEELLFRLQNCFEKLETKRKVRQKEEALRESEEKLRAIIESSADAIAVIDLEGKIIDCNPALVSMLDYTTKKELIGTNGYDLISPNDRKRAAENVMKLVTGGMIQNNDYSLIRKDGTEVLVEASENAILDAYGNINSLVSILKDITERKKTEFTLNENRERLDLALKNTELGMWDYNIPRGEWILDDRSIELLGSYPKNETEFKSHLTPDDSKRYSKVWNAVLKGENPIYVFEFKLKDSSGREKWLMDKGKIAEWDNNQKPIRAIGTIQDITQQKKNEEALIESERNLKRAQSISKIGSWYYDWNSETEVWSDECFKMFGLKKEDYPNNLISESESLSVCSNPEEVEKLSTSLAEKQDKYELEFTTIPINGKVRVIKMYCEVERDNDGNAIKIFGTDHDITELKKAEEELHDNENFLEKIIENIPSIIFLKDAKDLQFVKFNKAGSELLGYQKEELIGRNDYDFFPKDEADFYTAKDMDVLEKRELIDIPEEPVTTKDKGQRILHTKKIPIYNKEGIPSYLLGISEDITERKQAEEQIKTNLKEKETLLLEIHHRVKNNLTIVASLLNLQANSMEDKRLKEALSDSQSRVQAMSAIHETLYQSENLSAIDMNIYLSKLSRDVAQNYSIGSKINLNVKSENISIGAKQASPIGLIVNEMITNSFKYAFPENQEGEIKISLLKNDDQIELTYKDNGIGIPKGFDWQKADSLGLKLVKMLAENQLDGSIDMESKNGTKFTIKFNIDKA